MNRRPKKSKYDLLGRSGVSQMRPGVETRSATARPSVRADAESGSEFLTAKDLEVLLKIDVKTIYAYVQRGLIPYVRIQSNVRFIKRQIFEWIEERNYRPRPLR